MQRPQSYQGQQPSNVRSAEIDDKRPAKRTPPKIGFLKAGTVERAFIALLYGTLLVLVVLSILGTFYGISGNNAPLFQPRQMYADVMANTDRLLVAIAIQVFLSLGQYGARQLARNDRRWWVLYLAALTVSVYYNFQAYWTPITGIMVSWIAAPLIIAGDVLPEFIAIRHE